VHTGAGWILCELDPSCFAATARVHLSLDCHGTTDPGCDRLDLLRCRGHFSLIDRDAVPAEEHRGLVLMNIH